MPLIKRPYVASVERAPCSLANFSTELVSMKSFWRTHSESIVLITSSEMVMPRSSERNSLNLCSLQASSTNCDMTWLGAMEGVEELPHALKVVFRSRKCWIASSKLFDFK